MNTASKHHLLRLLQPQKPSTTIRLRRLSVASEPLPPTQEDLTQSAITQLKTTDDWTTNTNLRQQLQSLAPRTLLEITRQLETSTEALKLLRFIHEDPSPSVSPLSLSSTFQAVLEIALREGDPHSDSGSTSIDNLLELSKELKVALTPNAAILLIRYFFRVKRVQDSVLLYDELDPDVKNTHVKNALLDVLLKSDRFTDARQVLDEMLEPDAKFPVNQNTLNIVFPMLLRQNWGNESEEILALIPKFGTHGVLPGAIWLTRLITRLCRSYRNDTAWDLLHDLMKIGKLETGPCNALLSGLGKERNFQRINLFLKEMKENGIQPDIVTFGMLVNHLCKSRRIDDAFDTLRNMRDGAHGASVKPDVILYNTLIDGLCKVGRQEEGLTLIDQMKSDGCAPNVVTYNCLIDGFCKSGEIDHAQELFSRMNTEGVEPNVITVNTLVDGMCKHGRISHAMEFFRRMQEEKGLKGNAVTYSALISAFCGANNIERAMRLFDEMESVSSPDAILYYTLISGLATAGRLDDAGAVASKMKNAGFRLDLVSYNTLIGGFCRKKRLDKAVELLRDMEETGVKADGVTYNTLISYFCENGDFGSAQKFMKQMIADGNVPTVVTYGTLIHAYCLSGNVDEAMKIFDEMTAAPAKTPPNTVVYNILMEALCHRGQVERAAALMEGMVQQGVRRNTTTYNAMLKGLCGKNRVRDALRLMDQMTKQGCNPDYITMEILTDWFSQVGEVGKLRSFVQGYEVSSSTA